MPDWVLFTIITVILILVSISLYVKYEEWNTKRDKK